MTLEESKKFVHSILNDLTKIDIRVKIIKDMLSQKTNLTECENEILKHIDVLNSNIELICSKSKDWKEKL